MGFKSAIKGALGHLLRIVVINYFLWDKGAGLISRDYRLGHIIRMADVDVRTSLKAINN